MADDLKDNLLEADVDATQAQETRMDDEAAQDADAASKTEDAKPAAPQQVSLSDDAIARLSQTLSASNKPAVQPEPQLSEAEIAKLLNKFEAGEKDLEELGLPPTAAGKLNTILQAVVKQAATAAAYHVEMVRRQLSEQLTPLQQMHQEAQLERLKTEFYNTHDDLKGKERIVELVYGNLERMGWKPASKKAAFDELYTQVRQFLDQVLPGQTGSQNNNGQKAAAQTPGRRMPVLAGAGQTGGAARGAKGDEDKDRAFNRWLMDMGT